MLDFVKTYYTPELSVNEMIVKNFIECVDLKNNVELEYDDSVQCCIKMCDCFTNIPLHV